MTGGPDELWVDEDAGPVVRPFAVARGRARHARRDLDIDLIAVVAALGPPAAPGLLAREDERILELCRAPVSVAELASDLSLPIGVVRVLLGDLLDRGLVSVERPAAVRRPDARVLKEVIDGLRAL
ncbi:DUF742 domain-containing protein [Actinomadura hibisca]|uniref:DUF742 domain-containing protein n=1 Tax=Actinomadura hibisca TaxID=68565 RepID=UPI000836A5A4|nr:DUF742 domain-containing protein [Actinomadura hibisca]